MKRFVAALLLFSLMVPLSPAAGAESVEVPILMYHHMLRSANRWGDYVVSPEVFEGDLKYLKDRGYQTVSAAELSAWAQGRGTLPEKPVMITFDDGQESFAEYALPLLEKYDMCAVMAIVGSFADTYTEKEDHNINYSHLSWPGAAELAKSPNVELAGHSYDMHCSSPRKGCKIKPGESKAAYTDALCADLQKLESRFLEYTGSVPIVFAYPYGMYCEESTEILSNRGYEVLFTCNEHVNHLTGDPKELLTLGRFNRSSRYDREALFAKMGIE